MINSIDVFLTLYAKEFLVGKLAYKEKIIYFEYDEQFLQSGIELSPYKLPLKRGVFICNDNIFDGLFGLFGDSLPDGWGKLLLDRHFLKKGIKYRDINPLDRLGYIGKYGIGALNYRPSVDNLRFVKQDIVLDTLAKDSIKILKEDSQDNIDRFLELGGSSSGARPKAMIQLDKNQNIISGTQKLRDGYTHYMVKFASSADTKDIGKIEYIYSLMAKDAKIEMPDTQLLHGRDGAYFAIERFDRVKDERVHTHSVAGVTHSDFRVPVLDYDDLLTLTFHLCRNIEEVFKIYRLACFNLFSHNRDDHAKNFSFLLDNRYNWRLAPAYDLTFSYGPSGEHSTTYLGEGKTPDEKHLLELARKHHVKNAKEIIDEVKKGLRNFTIYAKEFDLSKQTTSMITQELKEILDDR